MQIDIGTRASNGWNFTHVGIAPGQSVAIKVVAGDSLQCFQSTNTAPTRTITVGNSVSFSSPLWIACPGGRSSVQITGQGY